MVARIAGKHVTIFEQDNIILKLIQLQFNEITPKRSSVPTIIFKEKRRAELIRPGGSILRSNLSARKLRFYYRGERSQGRTERMKERWDSLRITDESRTSKPSQTEEEERRQQLMSSNQSGKGSNQDNSHVVFGIFIMLLLFCYLDVRVSCFTATLSFLSLSFVFVWVKNMIINVNPARERWERQTPWWARGDLNCT